MLTKLPERTHSRIFRTQAEGRKENRDALNAIKIVPLFAQDSTFPFLSMDSFGTRSSGSSPEATGAAMNAASRSAHSKRDFGHFCGIPSERRLHAYSRARKCRATEDREIVTGRRFLVERALRTTNEPNAPKGRDS